MASQSVEQKTLAGASEDANGLEELIRLADAALFRAKRQGRNRVVVDTSTNSDQRESNPSIDTADEQLTNGLTN